MQYYNAFIAFLHSWYSDYLNILCSHKWSIICCATLLKQNQRWRFYFFLQTQIHPVCSLRSSLSGAIASTEVKLKLQEFLLSKKEPGPGGLNHSFPQKCWWEPESYTFSPLDLNSQCSIFKTCLKLSYQTQESRFLLHNVNLLVLWASLYYITPH